MDDAEALDKLPKEAQEQTLMMAAKEGRSDVIQKLFAVNPSLMEHTDDDGMTPLHIAVEHDSLDAVRTLLRAGVPANARAHRGKFEGMSALDIHYSSSDSKVSTPRGSTMEGAFSAELLQSVSLDDVEKVNQLLEGGVNPHSPIGPGVSTTLLDWALEMDTKAAHKLREFVQRQASITEGVDEATDAHDEVRQQSSATTSNDEAQDTPQRLLEEKDALINRLRQMLQDLAEEQEVMRRIVHQNGSTSVVEHFRRAKRRLIQSEQELSLRTAEVEMQASQLRFLRNMLDEESRKTTNAQNKVIELEARLSHLSVHRHTNGNGSISPPPSLLTGPSTPDAREYSAFYSPSTGDSEPTDKQSTSWRDPFGGYEDFAIGMDAGFVITGDASAPRTPRSTPHKSDSDDGGGWWFWSPSKKKHRELAKPMHV